VLIAALEEPLAPLLPTLGRRVLGDLLSQADLPAADAARVVQLQQRVDAIG
jgi:hypothetical protein